MRVYKKILSLALAFVLLCAGTPVLSVSGGAGESTTTVSVSLSTSEAQAASKVYITPTGTKYHLKSCRTIKNSKLTKLTVKKAAKLGYAACKVCNPPASSTSSSSSSSSTSTTTTTTSVSGKLTVRYLNVGQGDGTLISCGGKWLLIDGGPSSASSTLYSVLKTLGVKKLDYVIVTHPDADHCGAVAGALQYATVGKFYCSVKTHSTSTFKSVLSRLGSTKVTVPKVGASFKLGKAVVTFVGPTKSFGETNSDSLVCRIDYGTTSFLFTGDATIESEAAMLASGAALSANVLKVAHHGSKTSSSAAFLKAVGAKYAIVSVGKNSYGHPTSEVLSRLKKAGATVYRTDKKGHIIITSNGKKLTVKTSKKITG